MGYLIDLHTSAEWRIEHQDDHLHLDEVQDATELYLQILQEHLGKLYVNLPFAQIVLASHTDW